MNYVMEKEKQIQIAYECDVLIAGGGTAGISAALAAARQGANVLLVEQEWMLGGLATAGLVTVFLPLCDGYGTQHIFGICEELLKLSIKYGHEARYPDAWLASDDKEKRKKQRYEVQFNPQLFALAAEQLLLESGVRIMYGTKVLGVHKEGNRIVAATINNREGTSAVSLKTMIDCTGDAEVCLLAEEELRTYTQNFASIWAYISAYQKDAKEKEENRTPFDGYRLYTKYFQEESGYDGTKSEDLNRMMFFVHKKLLEGTLDLRKKEQNDRIMPVTMPSIPPVRMTRCIVGAYTLDESEEGKKFEDSIGRTTDWRKSGPVFSVPYRCLYGKTDNLLTAGRNISVTDDMWDITRCIPTCCVTGEAAGVAAALAAGQEQAVRDVDIHALQQILAKNGVLVD